MIQVIYFLVWCLVYVSALDYTNSRNTGFTFNCPKDLKPSVIPPEKLDHLSISVMGPGRRLKRYNYHQIGDLAENPYVNFKNRTLLYVGGYWEPFFPPTAKSICQFYQNRGFNVLFLKSMEFTKGTYPTAASFVPSVGKHVAKMLANLTTLGLDPKKLDMLGAGLAGHTMGFVAKNYRKITGRNISSITALDPAGPCFRESGPDERLDQSDADFIMTMAVNIDGLGIATPTGHVTFYVNGGEYQPADIWYLPCSIECSHVKAFIYWISALINPDIFLGMKCDTIQQARDGDCYDTKPFVWNSMDLSVDRNKPGIYFLPTLNRYPYGLGRKGLKKKHEHVMSQMMKLNAEDVIKV